MKLSSAVRSLARTQTARAILEAVAGGERDPKALAALAMGTADRAAIEKSLDGMQVGDHHPALIRGLLDHAAFLDRRVAATEDMIQEHLSTIEASWGDAADGTRTPAPGPDAAILPATGRLAEIRGDLWGQPRPSSAPSSPSSGTSWPTPTPGSPTSDPTGTPARPTATARPAAT
jgi:hypothetical protein